jgi:hypothetical protein
MKRPFPSAALWLLSAILAHAASPAVELNGIVNVCGLKCAAFIIEQPQTTIGRNFLLTEGESRFDIHLVSVDAANGCVRIENGGQPQTLRIRSAANFFNPGADETAGQLAQFTAPETSGTNQKNGGETSVNPVTIPGNPGFGTLPPIDRTARQAARESRDLAAASGANPAAKFQAEATADWYLESASIERDRLATAKDVLAGKILPYPRTPLTPASTPANLVDSVNGVYANHMADFMTHDWSQM